MESSGSVGIVGEGPSADSVMSWDRLIDNGTAGGRKRGSGIRDYRAERHFFSFTLLLPTAPSARDTGRCTDRWRGGVCVRVCVCVWGGDDIQLCTSVIDGEGEIQEERLKKGKSTAEVCVTLSCSHESTCSFHFFSFFLYSMSDLLVYFITAAIKVHLRRHFVLTRHIGYAA